MKYVFDTVRVTRNFDILSQRSVDAACLYCTVPKVVNNRYQEAPLCNIWYGIRLRIDVVWQMALGCSPQGVITNLTPFVADVTVI